MEIGEKILIIDDDETLATLLHETLMDEGFSVDMRHDGQDGIEAFHNSHPDLVIIDALLPRLNGFETVAQIRASDYGRQVPIIMISGIYKALKMHGQIKEYDIDDFIEKPFNIEDIIRRTKELLLIQVDHNENVDHFDTEGDLTSQSIIRILYLLYKRRENGTLALQKKKLKKRITIRSGEPTFVESNLVQECLGKLLIRKGQLTPDQCEESLKIMKSKKTRQGETLISMGILTPNELDEALKDQARQKLFDVFSWDEGNYKFTTSNSDKELTVLDLTLPQLLVRGVRNGFPLERLRRELDDHLDKAILIRENDTLNFDDFRLATWDNRILKDISQGQTSLRRLVDDKKTREMDIYQLIYVFYKTDMIEFSETDEDRRNKSAVQKVRTLRDQMMRDDYYALLGLKNTTTVREISEAYKQQVKIYHPDSTDLNQVKSASIETMLKEILQQLQKAQHTLLDENLRNEYDRELYYMRGVIPARPEKIFNADYEFKKIQMEMQRHNYEKSESAAKAMADVFDKDWRFTAFHGWARFKNLVQKGSLPKRELEGIQQMIAKAIRMNRSVADGYVFLAQIYKYADEHDKAISFFEKALEVDESCYEAERELRLLRIKESKKSKSFIKWK